MCSTNITTIWLILEKANNQKVQLDLYHIWSSWWKYVWWSQSEAVLYGTSTRETTVNIGCSTVTHQVTHYQSRVWNQANCSSPILSVVTDMGWKRKDSHLVPHVLSHPPITRACSEIMSRGFTDKSIELNYIEGTFCLNLNTLMGIVLDNFVQQKRWTKLSCPISIKVFKFGQQVPSI